MRRLLLRTALVLTLAPAVTAATAATCNVPSAAHPTVGAAVRDTACTLVQIAAGAFPENVAIARDLAVAGAGAASTFLEGYLVVSGAGVDVTLDALLVDGSAAGVAGCWGELLSASGGAHLVSGADVRVLQSGSGGAVCRLFVDGFESGGTRAWSASVP